MAEQQHNFEITGDAKPSVPVFTCLIYIRQNDDGTVAGRVANLAGIETSGSSEREALSKLVREFKTQVARLHETSQQIPWIDPPPPPLEDEQIRSVPIHL